MNKPGNIGDTPLEEITALSQQGAPTKYADMSAEDFLERVRNADRILENCRKSLKGV